MPEELDPTTARLAAELASNILPPLSKSLMAAIPSADFAGVFERSSRASQELRAYIEKIIRSDIDENRAGRSVLMQSIGSMREDVISLKRTVEKLPASLYAKPAEPDTSNQELMQKLDSIAAMLDELIHGVKSFGEAYASDREQQTPIVSQQIYSGSDAQLEKLITETLPSLEGLIRAGAKSQSRELDGFSREISALHEQNNIALIHEVKAGVSEELSAQNEAMFTRLHDVHGSEAEKFTKMLRLVMIMSGASVVLSVIMIVVMLLK